MKFLKYLLLLLFVMTGYAQTTTNSTYEYSLGESFHRKKGFCQYYQDDSGVIGIKMSGGYLGIRKFGINSLSTTHIEEHKLKELFPKHWVFEGMNKLGKYVYIYYSSWDGGKNNNERLFVRRIDVITGKYDQNFDKKIIQIDGKVRGERPMMAITSKTFNKFSIEISDQQANVNIETKIVVSYRKYPKSKKDTKNFDVYGVHVFDVDLNELWSQEYTMPYNEREFSLEGSDFGKDGNIYFLVRKYKNNDRRSKPNKKDERPNYHHELFTLNKDGAIEKQVIDFENRFVKNLFFHVNDEGEKIISGTYVHHKDLDMHESVFVSKFKESPDDRSNFEFKIPIAITDAYRNKLERKEIAKSVKKGASGYLRLIYHKLNILEDGSMLMVFEELGVREARNSRYQTHYYYNQSLVVFNISWNGVLKWVKKVPKNYFRTGFDMNIDTYADFLQGDKLCFLYLGRKGDVNVEPEKFVNYGGKDVLLTSINLKSGEMNTEALFSLKDKTVKLNKIYFDSFFKFNEKKFGIDFATDDELYQVIFKQK